MDVEKENIELLERMLKEHEKWLALKHKGFEGAEKQFCAQEFLDRCSGKRHPLSRFNPRFRSRELFYANFDNCDARDVDFTGSDLRNASFVGALAHGAIFNDANCTAANFSQCNLASVKFNSKTQLNWANLLSAMGPFVTGSFGQHHAVAYADMAAIGCELHPIDYWLEHGREIGLDSGYERFEIRAYLAWLKLAKKTLEEMNNG